MDLVPEILQAMGADDSSDDEEDGVEEDEL